MIKVIQFFNLREGVCGPVEKIKNMVFIFIFGFCCYSNYILELQFHHMPDPIFFYHFFKFVEFGVQHGFFLFRKRIIF